MIVTHKRGGGCRNYMLMDAGDIVPASKTPANRNWIQRQHDVFRDLNVTDFYQKSVTGDESLVAQSDEFLASLEDQVPMSRGWRNIDDVVGAVPNIPAFLAGHPQSMRRRERTSRDNAPLTIFMDLTSSMGISKSMLVKRGTVLLALVRLLVEHRAVELWVGATLSGGGDTGTAAWKIDTAPLDLARSSYHIADAAMSRLFGYAMCESMAGHFMGGWGNSETAMREMRELAGWGEVLHIPGIHLYDPMVTEPVKWLKRTMAKYVQQEDEAA